MRRVVEEDFFKKGSRVEVTSNEEGFTGAWYVATVLATPSSKSPPPKKRSRTGNPQTSHMYFIQYETLLTDDDPSKPLSEYVDVSFMRPEQPTEDDGRCRFEVNDVVDVNLRDGWWTGVVKRVVDAGSKYFVCFQNPPDEMECNGSELRIHLEWVNRKWVRPDKQETTESKDEEKHTRKKKGKPQESLRKFPKRIRKDPLEDSNGKSSEVYNLDSGAKDATDVINDELPSRIFDEGALLTWFDGMKSTTTMNNGVSNGRDLEENAESRDRQKRQNIEESQKMPFEKSSPVWKSIESLEVFQKTPQRPHFSPLVKCRADSREGLAVGHMITFANLVERALSMQVSQPQSIIESSLETLDELESHGFEVEAVRNRLTQLQSLKGKVGQLEESSKEAEGEIMKLNEEKKELEELMDKVEMKMRQIKEKLGAATSMKEKKVKQIDVLQSKVNFFADRLEKTKRDFERIAASAL